ncbi:MAG: hypothetical protein R6V85_06165 [Polyangia bacterium]
MVTRAKWDSKTGLAEAEIPADAISVDLKTRGNTLSFRKCGDAEADAVELATLALAARRDKVEKVELVWVPDDVLSSRGVHLDETPGDTPVSAMVDEHVDAVRLDYSRLGLVADRINEALAADSYKRWTRSQVRTVLVRGIELGRLQLEDLADEVREEVQKAMNKRKV